MQEFNLWSFSRHLRPDLYDALDLAIGVANGDLEPSADWQSELDDWAAKFVAAEMSRRVANLDADYVRDLAWSQVANNRKQAARAELTDAVRAGMLSDGVLVTGCLDNGPRSIVEAVELENADIDFSSNSLSIAARIWTLVQVELEQSQHSVEDGARATMEDALVSWFRDPKGGQQHRNSTNSRIGIEFRKAKPEYKDRKVTKTSIGKARARLGWGQRKSGRKMAVRKVNDERATR